MNLKTDLYGDTAEPALRLNPAAIILEIDLSGSKKTLLEMINAVRSLLEPHPDDVPVMIYFVAGSDVAANDWQRLIDYLKSIPNPASIVYRGVIHPETLCILTNFNEVTIDNDAKFVYIADKLSVILQTLLNRPDVFRNFLEQWIDRYKLIDRCYIDLPELQKLGFEFSILNQGQ